MDTSSGQGRGGPPHEDCGQDVPPPEVPSDVSGGHQQGTLDMQETLASILRVVNALLARN